MDSREFVLREDQTMRTLVYTLTELHGFEKISGLLTGEYFIEKSHKEVKSYGYMIRGLIKQKNVFFESESCTYKPKHLIDALNDACEKMSYSNWHSDKFHRCAEIVLRYCEDHEISIESVLATEHRGTPE